MLIAAVGGGSNAIGLFHPFLDDKDVQIVGVEAGGKGVDGEEHCASLTGGRPGVLHGNRTYLLQDERRPDQGRPLDLGRPRLSGHRAGTFLAEGYRPGRICADHRHGSAGSLPAAAASSRASFPALEPSHALAEVIKRRRKWARTRSS
jgi:tryptophan synthase beta chain